MRTIAALARAVRTDAIWRINKDAILPRVGGLSPEKSGYVVIESLSIPPRRSRLYCSTVVQLPVSVVVTRRFGFVSGDVKPY